MTFIKTTEQESHYQELENKQVSELLYHINQEDQKVAQVVAGQLMQIELVVNQIVDKIPKGGRLFYIGAGTSGRLGILDASECPPTFGVSAETVIGIIAGGDGAIRKAVEFAEDSLTQGWEDLKAHQVTSKDVVVALAASGTTPYVIGAMKQCKAHQITTACVTCNSQSPLSKEVHFPIEVVVGPEFVSGSSRMKAGTAQKMVLNMISTAVMIRLGHVRGNKMVDMQLSNNKLVKRAVKMVAKELSISPKEAKKLVQIHGSVRKSLLAYGNE